LMLGVGNANVYSRILLKRWSVLDLRGCTAILVIHSMLISLQSRASLPGRNRENLGQAVIKGC
jgi:hypothetical protein